MNRTHRRQIATPLAHSRLLVNITDLAAEYELRHAFRNPGSEPIEAVYTFPVPLDSAFMGMEATLAGDRRIARVMPRQRASRQYDDAIAEGDSAVLLEQLEPGLLSVNLGNLKPAEEGEIILRFASYLASSDGIARFSLPLVHRPRYGRSRLSPREEPGHDFAVEHPLQATIRITGLLANTPVDCSSHGAKFSREGDAQVLQLNSALLDRDLVLRFDLPADAGGQGRLVKDGDGAIGMVTFNLPLQPESAGDCDLCLVLDCSGSMGGDAIRQTRAALQAVAESLNDGDRIQVLRFGSHTVPLFQRPMKATSRIRAALSELTATIEADLGGTRMEEALDQALEALDGEAGIRRRAVILVTDGAVHGQAIERARQRAVGAGIRIFVVAVGSSAGVDVLQPLAEATAGALERAVPAEPINEAVMRHFRRARQPAPAAVEVDWGGDGANPVPFAKAYPGDAITAVAMLEDATPREVTVRTAASSEPLVLQLHASEQAPALRALAGQAAWRHAEREARQQLAMRYGLVTDETSAVLVKQRAEDDKADGLPEVVSVPHMVPAGMVVASATLPYALRRGGHGVAFLMRRPASAASQPVPSSRKLLLTDVPEEVRLAILRALVKLFLDEGKSRVPLGKLVAGLEASLQDVGRAYLKHRAGAWLEVQDAADLIRELLDATRFRLQPDQQRTLDAIPVRSEAPYAQEVQ